VIASWGTGVLMREDRARKTTRGWNWYGENEHRGTFSRLLRMITKANGHVVTAFKYTTPKLRLDHEDLRGTELLWAKSFHLICSPGRCVDLVKGIRALRQQEAKEGAGERPLFVWEPVPDLCTREEYENCLEALRVVDVVSPNHGELGGFFGKETNGEGHVEYRLIEQLCGEWLASGMGQNGEGGVVVRCGKDGCLVAREGSSKWIPAYHQSAEKVIDPTGGGNGFLGGLAVGLVRGQSADMEKLEEAARWGSIAASFAIEQVGMPALGHDGVRETWNGVVVEERLAEFKQRLDTYVQP
jgi:sugar/nucleoside kinase (ribokinase family)